MALYKLACEIPNARSLEGESARERKTLRRLLESASEFPGLIGAGAGLLI